MTLKAAFIFVAEDAITDIHYSEVDTGSVSVSTFAVKDYTQACQLAKRLVDKGFVALELCGGFGTEGVALVKQAINNRAAVGVVRFDNHPGLSFRSGDEIFK